MPLTPRPSRPFPLVVALVLLALPCARPAIAAQLEPERPNDPPAAAADLPRLTIAATPVVFGRFTSIQVNVNAAGANIVGDAANEPTIAVDPQFRDRMAIGWRQFNSTGSDFRQAGYAYTTNGGLTWIAGKIQSGTFRSDPVLGVDADGDFFYLSLDDHLRAQLFPSPDHGASWGDSVNAYGGDKPWMTIDRSAGPGRDHVYEAWSTTLYPPNHFARSLDDGASFQPPGTFPSTPVFGTMDVGPDGTLYVVGTDGPGGPFILERSANAQLGPAPPTFTTTPLSLGGGFRSGPPNPEGFLGQPWVCVDRSPLRSGWIYVLCSVHTGTDPLDVEFVRSQDGGATWTAPLRVNDDPPGNGAFQWFGTMSVSPAGRIDAVWYDTRGSADSTMSALYYSCSNDGGATWSASEQASPTWRSTLGWPKQKKIGDYIHMVSDATGADLAYAATFANEQNVYYVRLTPSQTAAVPSPERAALSLSCAPNPVRASATLRFAAPASGARVRVEVLDLAGRRVATLVDGFRSGGAQAATWDARDDHGRPVGPGVYLCRYAAAGRVETRRIVICR